MERIVYQDGTELRIIKGQIINEDNNFITVETFVNTYRIGKSSIISIRTHKEGDDSNES